MICRQRRLETGGGQGSPRALDSKNSERDISVTKIGVPILDYLIMVKGNHFGFHPLCKYYLELHLITTQTKSSLFFAKTNVKNRKFGLFNERTDASS